MSSMLQKIRDAWAQAADEQPSEYPPLPEWDALPIEMREAIISVFIAGRIDAQSGADE